MSNREIDLRGDGLLWLINRCLLHRIGYALGVDDQGGSVLLGDGTEQWIYSLDVSTSEAKARSVLGDSAVDRALAIAGPECEDSLYPAHYDGSGDDGA